MCVAFSMFMSSRAPSDALYLVCGVTQVGKWSLDVAERRRVWLVSAVSVRHSCLRTIEAFVATGLRRDKLRGRRTEQNVYCARAHRRTRLARRRIAHRVRPASGVAQSHM